MLFLVFWKICQILGIDLIYAVLYYIFEYVISGDGYKRKQNITDIFTVYYMY